ncbi:anthranilate synthase family protein [Streptomyces marincola]|uniref:anthranilate synthase family protein n=1 Tax=Streptomyces marincola TaxID=2878388 RepID=UPI001CF537E7|nr:anthranilate synthase family protein [Streptomyces marincola]UCM91528.1 anthranilate synthase family protein [Streptomyces marincola]
MTAHTPAPRPEAPRAAGTPDLLDRLLTAAAPHAPFALLHRPESGTAGVVDVLTGDITHPRTLADLPLDDDRAEGHGTLLLVPYRQLAERGYPAPDDGAPLVAMAITDREEVPLPDVLARVPHVPAEVASHGFDEDDDAYADTVRRVVTDEIGTGEGANFVIKRSFRADIRAFSPRHALSFFRSLLRREQGAYWTFVIHTGQRTLVGATPERHVSLRGGTATMNPVSGTYRYPATGPTLPGLTAFLADEKETDELYMVVDEELKMMARLCDGGARIKGPYLKEMARLAHTEYLIEGRTRRDVREILRETMFAPTVTGSPLESAARVISRHEPEGRGYYSGVAALIGRDRAGDRTLDSAILIRTADIDPRGHTRIDVGATLVRHSVPAAEAAETRAKSAALLDALKSGDSGRLGRHPDVRAALRRRNDGIADFWLSGGGARGVAAPRLAGVSALVVDAEDTFTAMIRHQLSAIGLDVTVRRFDEPYTFDGHDLVVMGPGPGDPRRDADPKIRHLAAAIDALLAERRAFLAVCLSHQVLSRRLGLHLTRLAAPHQGTRRRIDLFGSAERVGYYNTFAARSAEDKWEVAGTGVVDVSRDARTGEVHALRGPHFASVQFHAESVLTVDGPRILARLIQGVLDR